MYCKCFFLTLLSSFDKCSQNGKKNDLALVNFMHQDWKDLLEFFLKFSPVFFSFIISFHTFKSLIYLRSVLRYRSNFNLFQIATWLSPFY